MRRTSQLRQRMEQGVVLAPGVYNALFAKAVEHIGFDAVYVTDHPWFAVTDGRGRFRLVGVPPGRYTLGFAHADTGLRAEREVEVRPGGVAEVNLEWEKVGR